MASQVRGEIQVNEAVVLAGGLGTRLSKVLPGFQKVVAPILGEPFLARVLRKLHAEGINRVVLALGHLAQDAMSAIELYVPVGMTLVPSIESSPLGTGGAIRHALPLIQSSEVLIVNGDSIIDYSLADLVRFHHATQANVSMVLCKVADISRYGSVTVDNISQVVAFQEKTALTSGPGIINAGIYLMSRKTIMNMPYTHHSLEHTLIPKLCSNGLYGLITEMPFIDIGTPADYAKADHFFSHTEKPL